MRGIRGQFIHPGLFETDIADAQVGGAFIQIDQLLGGRVVGFGAASFRNHADYLEFIACNGFCEIGYRAVRLQKDISHNYRFVIAEK